MTTTKNSSTTTIYNSDDTEYSGVVKVSSNGYYGTGTLLYDGRAILTAAHIFTDLSAPINITFELTSGRQILEAKNPTIISSYDDINSNNDLALVWLEQQAPKEATRYEIYRETNEFGQIFSLSGYGVQGTGIDGYDETSSIQRLQSLNTFDATAGDITDTMGEYLDWNPNPTNILVADFDNGLDSQDALGNLLGVYDQGNGAYEGLISPGDSGGPAFIDFKVAGVASYVASLYNYYYSPDIDEELNSSFGEIGFWQRVSSYEQFIDQSIRANYQNTPTTIEDIQTQVIESKTGTITTNYFYLSILGKRETDILSVQYTTRDGTATAGEDYIEKSGQITVYPEEEYVLIPVEIIGDSIPEADEVFYLDIFDPMGATLENNSVILTAQRTIIDDDGYFV